MKKLLALLATVVLVGCGGIFTSIVTIKEVGDSISKEYAALHKKGLITPEVDARAEAIHADYRRAMGGLAAALEASKVTGNVQGVEQALQIAKNAITPLLDLITPFLVTKQSTTLRTDLNRAVASK